MTNVTDSNPKAKPWKRTVALYARAAHHKAPLKGALEMTVRFVLLRPQYHFGTGKNAGTIKADALSYPITKPDVLKLTRAVEDACTGIIYVDDAQIVDEHIYKRYGKQFSCEVEIRELAETGPTQAELSMPPAAIPRPEPEPDRSPFD